MVEVLVVHPKSKSKTTELILEAMRKPFDVVNLALDDIVVVSHTGGVEIRSNGRELNNVDYFFPRIDGKRVLHGYNVVKAYDYLGIKHPYPAETLRIAHDKFLTTLVLGNAGLPVPRTFALKSGSGLKKVKARLNFPVVVKIISGAGGKGVMFANSEEELAAMVGSMEALNQEIVLQEFIPNKGEDIRILVLGEEVAAAMKRIAPKSDKRANISGGGKAVSYDPPDEVKEIAIKASETLEARILAVDIIIDTDGNPWIIEVNVNPGIRGLMKATDKNIARMIAEFVEREIKS